MITFLGLSTGFASFIILFHFTTYELSFDQFHKNKDEIYRVVCYPGKGIPNARNYNSLGIFIKDQFPEVKEVVRFWKVWNSQDGEAFKADGKIHYEQKVIQSDSTFFMVFPSLLKDGDPKTVLREPNSIVISESKAKAYFGSKNPIGQVISDSEFDLTVTGIMFDTPKNSHFEIDIIRTYYDDFFLKENWKGMHLYTYLTIDPKTDINALKSKLESAVRAKRTNFEHLAEVSFEFQPITDIHLSPNLAREISPNTDKTLVYFLMGIGIMILIMAWINHVNLTISSFFSRAKELSIRGVVGAKRSNLIRQLLTEYLLLNTIAIPIAFLFINISNQFLISLGLVPNILNGVYQPALWIGVLVLLLMGSVMTGLYPSILIRKIQFSNELKTKSAHAVSGSQFRSSLIVIQFFASIILISGVLIMRLQQKFLKTQNKNMEIEQVIAVRNPTAYTEFEPESEQTNNYNLFKEQLISHTAIEYVAVSSAIPGSPVGFSGTNGLKIKEDDPYDPTQIKLLFVSENFLDVYSIPLLEGRSFSNQNAQDLGEESIMLSENAIKHLGFSSPESAIGQTVEFHIYTRWNTYQIIGVFKDYAHESVKSTSYPSILYFSRYESYIMHHLYHSIKIAKDANIEDALAHLKKTWATIWPEKPLEYQFVDQVYEQQYRNEKVLESSFVLFSFIAIFLACLGVLGISHHEIQLKMKEISIRKVLGSSIYLVIRLLSVKYIQLILIAACLAVPLAIWLAGKWLENYPIRISLDFWIFLIPIGVIFCLVFLTSGSLIYKSANTNPAKILRSE